VTGKLITRRRVGITAIAALVFAIGAVCGGAITRAGMLSEIKEREELAEETLRLKWVTVAGVEMTSLKDLRNENYERAIEWLEVDLDGNLVGFSLLADDLTEKMEVLEILTLKHIKAYRDQYPRKTGNPQIDDDVARVLNMADQIRVRVKGADGY